MKFELVLQAVVQRYEQLLDIGGKDYQTRTEELLKRVLKAQRVEFVEEEEKETKSLLYETEKGRVELSLTSESRRLTSVAFSFNLNLPLPEGTWNSSDLTYTSNLAKGGRVIASLGRKRSSYELEKEELRGLSSKLDLKVTNRPDLNPGYFIESITFPKELLGPGVLSSLFEGLGYTDLERLVERRVQGRAQ